jgi:hypothetical protein
MTISGRPLLYFKDNTTLAKAINTDVNGYTIDTPPSPAVDWTNHKKPKEANAIQVDKEHVWVKSHGFSPQRRSPFREPARISTI